MKRLRFITLTLFFVITFDFEINAQCPLTQAIDFTATDCYGTEIHLFDILDGGQAVLIDFFFTTCGPCQQATPKIVESYYAMGCNMHDVFYMEIATGDSEAACLNWVNTYGVEYPTISGEAGGTAICNQYGIPAYPTVILIMPDRSIVIQDLWPINNAQTVIAALEQHGLQQHDCNTYYYIDATANPSNGGTVTGSGTYQQGQQCTVSATPASNFTFLRWTENGSQVSTNANYTFTVTGNRTLVAQFQAQPQNYNISVSANPTNGGTVTGGGIYQQGQQCTVSATPASNFTFLRWTENGAQVSTDADYTFTVTGNRTLVAQFQAQPQNYNISVSANPTNGGTVSGGGTYAQGSTCTLHATPNSGYSFVKWTRNGTQVSTNPNYSFTVTGNAAYVAHFQQNTTNYTITATASPSNAGTITGAGSYASGSTCTLRATPNSGYTFANWLENGTSVSTNATYSFTVTGNRNLVAVFDVATTNYTITATANPSNGGSVAGGGTYASGSTCTLRATANSGYTFVHWTKNGTQVSTNPNYSFTVTGNASYVANFEPIPEEYTITVNTDPANGGTVSGGGTYAEGSTCVISAMPNEGYVFENWTRNGTVVSTEPTYSIVVNRNLTFVAHFAQNANQATITATAEPVEGGSVLGGGTYELGSNCTLNAVAAVGYEFVNWTLNGSQVSTDASFSFTITGNAVYVAHFSKIVNHYTVSANVQPANAGSVIGAGTYEEGTSCTLIAIANPTYTFVSWTENGAVVSTDEQYTFTVERDRNLVAVFSQGLFYTITASAGGNGSITPEGEVMVNPGEDKTFAIIPNSGCRVSKVLVDGVDVGPVESYTFRSVNANHSIRAQFSGLGVDDNPMHELTVYPNPANEMLNIKGNDIKRIAVFDLLGVQLADKEINDDQAILPTSNFAQGTYILKVEFEDGSVGYSRFVVAR